MLVSACSLAHIHYHESSHGFELHVFVFRVIMRNFSIQSLMMNGGWVSYMMLSVQIFLSHVISETNVVDALKHMKKDYSAMHRIVFVFKL